MEFFETVNERYSCRNYSDKPPEGEKLVKCVEAAMRSPSACNSQPWKFIIVNGGDTLKAVRICANKMGMNRFALNAPAFLVMVNEGGNITSKLGEIAKNLDFSFIDAGIAVQTYCLAAAAEGLSTCIMGMFDEKGLKKVLGIPKGKRISLIVATGYEKEKPLKRTPRKDTGKTLNFNKY